MHKCKWMAVYISQRCQNSNHVMLIKSGFILSKWCTEMIPHSDSSDNKKEAKNFIFLISRVGFLWEGKNQLEAESRRPGSACSSRGYARAPMGSQAGRTMGSCCMTSSTSGGRKFLSTTTSYTYSENHSSVMIRYPAGRGRDEARTTDRDKRVKWEMSTRKIAGRRSGTPFNLPQQKLLWETSA